MPMTMNRLPTIATLAFGKVFKKERGAENKRENDLRVATVIIKMINYWEKKNSL